MNVVDLGYASRTYRRPVGAAAHDGRGVSERRGRGETRPQAPLPVLNPEARSPCHWDPCASTGSRNHNPRPAERHGARGDGTVGIADRTGPADQQATFRRSRRAENAALFHRLCSSCSATTGKPCQRRHTGMERSRSSSLRHVAIAQGAAQTAEATLPIPRFHHAQASFIPALRQHWCCRFAGFAVNTTARPQRCSLHPQHLLQPQGSRTGGLQRGSGE